MSIEEEVVQFVPVQPRNPSDLGRIETLASELILKNVHLAGEISGLELSRAL